MRSLQSLLLPLRKKMSKASGQILSDKDHLFWGYESLKESQLLFDLDIQKEPSIRLEIYHVLLVVFANLREFEVFAEADDSVSDVISRIER